MNEDNHIYKLASIIAEEIDQVAEKKTNLSPGYSCGPGCWTLEEIQFDINGQMLWGSATIGYVPEISSMGAGSPATRMSPAEPEEFSVIINDPTIMDFEIYDNEELLVSWSRKTGFTTGEVPKPLLKKIAQKIMATYEEVEEAIQDHELVEGGYIDEY